jgi:hypothetical protein
MSGRDLSQIAKKLLKTQLIIAEAEQFLKAVKADESMPFSERESQIAGAMRKLADGKAIIENVLKELGKRMDEGSA